jgi:hypothetical protein
MSKMTENYGFVYIWYDNKYNRYYIGCHWGTEDDGYICSSSWMKQAYKKRSEDFKRRIISRIYTNRNNLLEEEYKWLRMIKQEELGKRYYNLNNRHFGPWTLTEAERLANNKHTSNKTKEAMWRPEVREKYLESLKTRNTRSSDLEVREKRRKSMIGKYVGKDTSKAVAASVLVNKGKKCTPEHIAKVKENTYFNILNQKNIKCKYCSFVGNPGNVGRYHNNNCKQKNIEPQ